MFMKVTRFLLAIISSILLVNFSIRVYDEQIKIRFYNEIETITKHLFFLLMKMRQTDSILLIRSLT